MAVRKTENNNNNSSSSGSSSNNNNRTANKHPKINKRVWRERKPIQSTGEENTSKEVSQKSLTPNQSIRFPQGDARKEQMKKKRESEWQINDGRGKIPNRKQRTKTKNANTQTRKLLR